MKLSLIENAIDSLKHGIQHYLADNPDSSDYKYAILHLVQAVELLYKERLRQEHEAFLFTDIDIQKTHKTVSIELAQKRLVSLCKIPLPLKERNLISSLVKLRNQIQHYEFDISTKRANAIMAKVVAEILSFSQKYLDLDIREKLEYDLWAALISITDFMESFSQKKLEELKNKSIYCYECPDCGYNSLENLEHEEFCHICGYSESLVECDICHQSVRESETETIEDVDYDIDGPVNYFCTTVCQECMQTDESDYYDYSS